MKYQESLADRFPYVTFILASLMVGMYVLTSSNLLFYENLFGFIPKRSIAPISENPLKFIFDMFYILFTLVSYPFIHVSYIHLFGNIVVLLIAGMAVEKFVGRNVFLLTFLASGNIAAIFDILGRYIAGISATVPFVGSSGAIFGLLGIASLVQSSERVPTFLVLLSLIPFLQYGLQFIPTNEGAILYTSLGVMFIFSVFLLAFVPSGIPVSLAMIIFLLNWMFTVLSGLQTSVSNVGHLGGVLGGFISLVIFSEKINKPKEIPEQKPVSSEIINK